MPDDTRHPFGDHNGHNGTNGSRPHGMQSQPTPFDEVAEPVDLVAVQADDELLNALAAGMSVSAPGVSGYDADDRVAAILAAWKADVDADPIPELVDVDTAVSTVEAARPPSGRSRHLVPVAAAAAFIVLAIGGVSVTSYNAQPDDALWGVSKVLYSERAESVEAAARVEDRIDAAKAALAAGQPVVAAQELAQAQRDLEAVRPQEGQSDLAEAQDFLRAKAAETPEGQKVDPASPLATQPSREVPESVRDPRPSESEDADSATSEPDPSTGSGTGEGKPGPEVAGTPDGSTGDPTTSPTVDPRRAVAPEQGTSAPTSRPAPAPGSGNGEGGPDEPTRGTSPTATPEGRPDPTSSPAPPQSDEGDADTADPDGPTGPTASGERPPATGN